MDATLTRWVETRGAPTQSEVVSFIAGAPVRGSWWAHPDNKRMYLALEALSESDEVLPCKLREGLQTFVHRRLWPALVVLQRAPGFWPALSPAGEALLQQVREAGRLQTTHKARAELERTLRVLGRSEHTPSGKHQMVLVPFEAWVPRDVARAAEGLSLADALAQLEEAGCQKRPAAPGAR